MNQISYLLSAKDVRSTKELEFDIPGEAARFFDSSFLIWSARLLVCGGGDLLSKAIKNLVPYFANRPPCYHPIDYLEYSETI